MKKYKCSICDYSSNLKEHVIRHISKKKSCGTGIKEVIETPVEIKCNYCNKIFTNAVSHTFHIKNSCKHKDDAKDEEIKRLKEELKNSRNITINNNTNNINIIMVNNYEKTSLAKITNEDFNNIIKNANEVQNIIPRLIRYIHFNDDIPENHNICITDKNRNHLNIFKNGNWEITDKNTEIINLISDKETNLGDWVDENGKKYPKAAKMYNDYLDRKIDIEKDVIEEVEQDLYNKRIVLSNIP